MRLNKEADVPVNEPGALISARHRQRASLKPFEDTKRCTLTGSAPLARFGANPQDNMAAICMLIRQMWHVPSSFYTARGKQTFPPYCSASELSGTTRQQKNKVKGKKKKRTQKSSVLARIFKNCSPKVKKTAFDFHSVEQLLPAAAAASSRSAI